MKNKSKVIHGPYVRQRTYRKLKDKWKDAVLRGDGLALEIKNLRVALDGYYQQHNQWNRCECGWCHGARDVVGYAWKPTIEEMEKDRKTLLQHRLINTL